MIYTTIVTYNRLRYTKACVESYVATCDPEHSRLVVVDNASADGTREWLLHNHIRCILNDENRYPGAACNQGWDMLLGLFGPCDLLHRSDNDIEYLAGWQEEVELMFDLTPDLALLGLLNLHEDRGVNMDDASGLQEVHAVGGNVFVPAGLYPDRLRWTEQPWPLGEDGVMSGDARAIGTVARLNRTVANNMAFHRYADFPDYYEQTASVRGLPDARVSV